MDYKQYEEIASRVRVDIVKAVHKAGSGHPGGSLSAADIVTALYFKEMNIDPANPRMVAVPTSAMFLARLDIIYHYSNFILFNYNYKSKFCKVNFYKK